MKGYKLYESIAKVPIGRWIALHDENDIMQLVIEGKPPIDALVMCWYKINDQYIEKYGDAKSIEEQARQKKQAAKFLIKYLKTGDRFNEFEANILLDEMNTPNEGGPTMLEEKGYVEEALGFWMDPEKVLVPEYYAKKKQAQRKWQTQSKIGKSRTKGSSRR